MITKMPLNNQGDEWVNINTDNKADLLEIYQEYQIDEEFVAYSLDRNERAHLDYDQGTETFVIIFNIPNLTKIDNHYETIPMTFIMKDQRIITVTNSINHYAFFKMKKFLDNNRETTLFSFLFGSLFVILDSFFPYIEEMDDDRITMNRKLRQKTTKQNLFLLSDLETGIFYFLSASKQNVVLLEQVKTHTIFQKMNDIEREELEDALIEAKQIVEMTQLSSQILEQLSGTYNNVLNNNLNDTMKVLTILSILLTVPTIVTGFFGMNMPLPLEDNIFGWLITILISAILWFSLSFILSKVMKRL